MEIVSKLTLVAAIILLGYNISDLTASYEAICNKTKDLKDAALEAAATDAELRRSNILLSLILSVSFVVLTYFSGLSYWIVTLVALKLGLTLYCSDSFLVRILRSNEVPKKFYMLSKIDALANALFGLAIALVLVL